MSSNKVSLGLLIASIAILIFAVGFSTGFAYNERNQSEFNHRVIRALMDIQQ